MKKILVLLSFLSIGTFAIAQTISIDWKVDGNTYAQNTCEYGGTLTVPATPPTKYGYTFQGWDSYQLLEYIESTGTQYIDTGYKSSNNTKVQLQLLCKNLNTFVFGSRNDVTGDAQKRFGLFFASPWNPQYANQNGSGERASAGTIYNIEMSQDGFYVNGSLNTSFASATFSGNYNMYLFANNTTDTTIGYGTARIYVFKIYESNILVRNLIPAKRNSDNVLGMYDTVTGTFFTNAGTGEFVAGPVVQ